jgi:adenine-specific DNA-methyltransferase
MAKKQKSTPAPADDALKNVSDYRFPEATRKNNPPAKIAAEGYVPLIPKAEYSYSPRRPPELRFDPTGRADGLPELLAKATRQKLTAAEAWALAEALRAHEAWLEWAGKREAKSFLVDPVALHIHERVSTQAILRVAAREDVNRSLFADPEQEYNEAVQFYKHDVDWSNRLILGDSLQVMSSLARREDLAGKVQMICKRSSSRSRGLSSTSWRWRVRMPGIGGGAYWRYSRDISFSRKCSATWTNMCGGR